MEKTTDLELKYQKLATEYSKVILLLQLVVNVKKIIFAGAIASNGAKKSGAR